LKTKHYSLDKKLQAVASYRILGNSSLVSAVIKVPPETIRWWKTQPWWSDLEAQMNEEENVKKNVALKKIIDKSLELISDRLENGDYVFDQKTGEVKRKPVGLRDLSKVANEMMVQQAETAKVNAPTTSKQTIEEALKKIATEFANLARGVANDKEIRQGLPSEVRVGEEFVEAGADESSGGETFEASGVLQAPEEEINGA
jgi:hypothetical protein